MNPLHNQSGSVLAIAVAILVSAFVSEDGATITAATLAATSVLDVRLAFLSAFAGLWVGDLGVYGVARWAGPRIRRHRWFQSWFAKKGTEHSLPGPGRRHLGLALSRFFPGTRLPAYVTAGLQEMPLAAFASVTAISAIAWILLVFAVLRLAPSGAAAAGHSFATLSLAGLALFAFLACGASGNRRFGKEWAFWGKEL